jgi:uncharacterized protein (TIGR02302 family)
MDERTVKKPDETGFIARLRATRYATALAIAVERIWPLILPLLLVGALFMTVSWFGLFRVMPDIIRLAVLTIFAAAALVALILPLRFRWPNVHTVDRRLESVNKLEHAPVTTQSDALSEGSGEFAAALWAEHKRRMAESLGRLESGLPNTGVPARDPYAIRAAVAILFVVAFAYSSGPNGGSPEDAFSTHIAASTVPPRVDAWATPPQYTAKAPIYLTAKANLEQGSFTVPAGSVVTIRISGGNGDEKLVLTGPDGKKSDIAPAEEANAAASNAETKTGAREFRHVLDSNARLALSGPNGIIDDWMFTAIPDTPPKIDFKGEPQHALNGTLELDYAIEDDYGAASAEARFALADKAGDDVRPLYEAPEMKLSVPRRGANSTDARTTKDLTEHPWAGSKVTVQLVATDDAGQTGSSSVKEMVLPERIFTNPLAKAVVEQRRILALDANAKTHVLNMLDAVTLRPEDTIPNLSHYLGLMTARSRLEMAKTDDDLRGVVSYMWQLARGIEDGDLSIAERRLRTAQEALKQALENGASDEEIEKLMSELREAMNEYMKELAKRALENPQMAQPMPFNGQELRRSDLDRMLDQIENLAKQGARDKAQELLSQLENMMNNLMAGQHQRQQGDSMQSQMNQQMNELGEMMRRQQELMDQTFRNQQRRQQGRQTDRGNNQGQDLQNGEGMSEQEFADALRQLQEGQGKLRERLQQFEQGLKGMGIDPGEEFGNAGESMGRAGEALGQADGEEAIGQQGQALEAMRRGAQGMMNQMQQAMQGQNGGSEEGRGDQRANRDPLGRPRATSGPDFGESVKIPDEIDVQSARRILDAIRKRLGDALSPQFEKDYLERLLQAR